MSVGKVKSKVRVHLFISGKVQGVFFRDTTKKKAQEWEVKGWVRNLPDGRVEAVFEGEKENVEKLLSWARKGPLLARVENVEVEWEEYKGEFQNFEIR